MLFFPVFSLVFAAVVLLLHFLSFFRGVLLTTCFSLCMFCVHVCLFPLCTTSVKWFLLSFGVPFATRYQTFGIFIPTSSITSRCGSPPPSKTPVDEKKRNKKNQEKIRLKQEKETHKNMFPPLRDKSTR